MDLDLVSTHIIHVFAKSIMTWSNHLNVAGQKCVNAA